MKWLKRLLGLVLILIIVVIIAVVIIVNPLGPSPLNNYARSGELSLAGLKAPVTVHRDEKGMAYIYAQNEEDLFMAQGFVTAQDRLFQMELIKLFASGRICELAGEKAKGLDTRMRTLGFHRNAKKHAELLNPETQLFLQKYVDGVNAFIASRPKSIHLEFKLAGIKPSPWTMADSLTILYYMGWGSAANLKSEIIAQMLVEKLGIDKAAEIFPLNFNPDDEPGINATVTRPDFQTALLDSRLHRTLLAYANDIPLKMGSNNWITGPALSAGGKPIVANDPHLEANPLPGPWYPCGLITPELRAIGVSIAGIGGMVIGRTDHIAIGVTNAYGDTQDLYVETVDPGNPTPTIISKATNPYRLK
jgi:penicillin amidase